MSDPLDILRRQAKTLQKSYESGGTEAIARVKARLPNGKDPLKRADFLHVIALENSFASWPMMKEAVATHGMDRAAKVQRLKIALDGGQEQRIAALLADTPDLARGHFGLQCALLEEEEVTAALAADPGLAVRDAGFRRPILHLTFSPCARIWPERARAMIRIAQLLVDHGADVNDSFPYAHDGAPLSALYGAMSHARNMDLVAWLLENGANPNDGESLYHATELGHTRGVEMLLAHGAKPGGTNALLRAMDFDDPKMVRVMLEGGADPNEGNGALHHAALRQCSLEVCELLLEFGANPKRESRWSTPYSSARIMGHNGLAELIAQKASVTPLSPEEELLALAAEGRVPEGTYLDEARLPPAYAHIIREILHLPGKLDHVKALVALGLFYDKPDAQGITPVQTAGWEGLPEVMGYFLSLGPDLSHVNSYGGTLLSTIVHGSQNNDQADKRDHIGCARMALEHGVALPKRMPEQAGVPAMAAFLADWAQRHPGQVVHA